MCVSVLVCNCACVCEIDRERERACEKHGGEVLGVRLKVCGTRLKYHNCAAVGSIPAPVASLARTFVLIFI